MKRSYITGILIIMLMGCKPSEQPIDFGKDACTFCKMNIVDEQHAAEIVTHKGRVYKFDAIECMLQDETVEQKDVAMYLVMDYNRPGNFIDAKEATYLISANIPSPMGAYLSAFKTKQEAMEAKETNGGELYPWTAIWERIRNKE